MAPRANWKGYLAFSPLSCPVSMYPAASEDERVSFRRINKLTGRRCSQLLVDAESQEIVEKWNIGKGYELNKNEFILMEDEELDSIKLESTHTIELSHFVPASDLQTRWRNKPYYIIVNEKPGLDAYIRIRDALAALETVAIARVVLQRREYVMAIEPFGKGLVGTTLRFHNEVKDENNYFDEIPDLEAPNDEAQNLVMALIKGKVQNFDPTSFKDRYEEGLAALINVKQTAGVLPVSSKKETPVFKSYNLIEELRGAVAKIKEAQTPKLPQKEKGKKGKKVSA
jgi:DNA end-binding protein Ku